MIVTNLNLSNSHGQQSHSSSVYSDVAETAFQEEQQNVLSLQEKISETATQSLTATKHIFVQGLVLLDHALDLVPIGSTASNIIDLGIKHAILDSVDKENTCFKPFIEHLEKKQTTQCVLFGIPLIGNVSKLGCIAKDLFSQISSKKPESKIQEDKDYAFSTIGMRLKKQEEDLGI